MFSHSPHPLRVLTTCYTHVGVRGPRTWAGGGRDICGMDTWRQIDNMTYTRNESQWVYINQQEWNAVSVHQSSKCPSVIQVAGSSERQNGRVDRQKTFDTCVLCAPHQPSQAVTDGRNCTHNGTAQPTRFPSTPIHDTTCITHGTTFHGTSEQATHSIHHTTSINQNRQTPERESHSGSTLHT